MECLFLLSTAKQHFFFDVWPPLFLPKTVPNQKQRREMWMVGLKSHTQLCFPFSVAFDSFISEFASEYLKVRKFAQSLSSSSPLNVAKCYTIVWLWVCFWLTQLCYLHGTLSQNLTLQRILCKGVLLYGLDYIIIIIYLSFSPDPSLLSFLSLVPPDG